MLKGSNLVRDTNQVFEGFAEPISDSGLNHIGSRFEINLFKVSIEFLEAFEPNPSGFNLEGCVQSSNRDYNQILTVNSNRILKVDI